MRKNKNSKRIVAGVLALGIIAGAIGIGAYLSDTEVKKDVYTVGNVQAEIVAVGDMELDNVGALLPGTVHQYERAAMNTGINDAFVFMSLTIPYEMVGVSDDDGSQIGERVRQLFIPGVDGGYIGSEWKLVDIGYIGQYEIEDNGQYCGEHDKYSAVVGDTITYVYGYIGDNADGSLKALASGETTSNLVETMELTNLYHADKINGQVSTKLYAIQSANVNGGLTDVNGVWAVINKAISGENQEASTLTYSINNTRTGDAVGYAPLKLVDENGNVVATSVANADGSGQFQNVPTGEYAIETAVGDLVLTGGSTGYGLRNKTAAVTITGEDASVALGLELPVNTLVQGPAFNAYLPAGATAVEFVAMPQTYSLADRTVPAGAIDVSEAADGSVMAWMEDTTFYVVAMDGGVIYANPNCRSMFQGKSQLTYIGTDNLNMTGVYDGSYLFDGCGPLVNAEDAFDFSNLRGFTNAFANCKWLTEYTVPDGVTTIPINAFAGCSNLTKLVLPDSIKTIGNAFFRCESLTSINFPEGLEKIDSSAFYFCTGLTSVDIPASVTHIGVNGYNAFFGCEKLTAINVDPANENYASVDGVLFTKDMKTLAIYPAGKPDVEYITPSGVETIHNYAFYHCQNLETLTLSEGVATILDNAFSNAMRLRNINFASTISNIGSNAFEETRWLEDQMILNPGEKIIVNGIVVYEPPIEGDYRIPEGTTIIPANAFYGNNKLTSVYIPASVTEIGQDAFAYCSGLKSITFAEDSQLKTIQHGAFRFCSGLTSIELPDSLEVLSTSVFFRCYNLSSVTLSENLTTLSSAFGFTKITSITIPNSVKTISSFANPFDSCDDLVEIVVADDHPYFTVINGALYDKNMTTLYAYPAGKTDAQYIIPNGVKTIASSAFGNLNNGHRYISELVIPASVTEISGYAFSNCSSLRKIKFCGTQAEWNLINFGVDWNKGANASLSIDFNYVSGSEPEVPAQKTGTVNFSVNDIVDWYSLYKDKVNYYELSINNYEYSVRLDPYKSSSLVLPEGTYSVTVYAVLYNGSRYSDKQNITEFTVTADKTNDCVIELGQRSYTVSCNVSDFNQWDKTVDYYIISFGDNYSKTIAANQYAGMLVPAGTYDVAVTVVFTDGSTATSTQDITSVNVNGYGVTCHVCLGEKPNYDFALSIQDNLYNGNNVSYYQVNLNSGKYVLNVTPNKSSTINLPYGRYSLEVIVHFNDGTSISALTNQSMTILNHRSNGNWSMSLGYQTTMSVTDNSDWGDKTVQTYQIKIGNNWCYVSPNYSSVNYLGATTYDNIMLRVRFTDGTFVDVTHNNNSLTINASHDNLFNFIVGDVIHTCESMCPICKLCLDVNCLEANCKDKCNGHETEHKCESWCATCNGCKDDKCAEKECSTKCSCSSYDIKLSEDQIAVVIVDNTSNTANVEKPSIYYIFVGGKAHQAELAYGNEYVIIDGVTDGNYSVSITTEYPTLGVQAPAQNIESVTIDANNRVITVVLSD